MYSRRAFCLSCGLSCGNVRLAAQSGELREASGVARAGQYLLVADDADIGAYYRVPLRKGAGPLIDLNAQKPERVRLKSRNLGVDLEGITLLADGRLALLSERLRSLVSDDGVVAEYDSELAEVGKRGLEGVAARPLGGGNSRVAVLWEGGYGDFGVSRVMRGPTGSGPWQPVVVVHDVPRNARVGRVSLRSALAIIELKVPMPEGREPEAQRFRAPDLVWYKFPSQPETWGFLALLTSQNALANPVFEHRLLQRFDMQGNCSGDPLDLAGFAPPRFRQANWEGLSWFDPGRSVVVVHEGEPGLPPHALIIELPRDWQFELS